MQSNRSHPQSSRSQPLTTDLLQMEADIQRRLTVAPNPHRKSTPRPKPNLALIRASRSLGRFAVNLDFSDESGTPRSGQSRRRLFLRPLAIALSFALTFFILLYTVSVNKFVFYNITRLEFDASRRLTVSVSNCQIVLEPLGAAPNTLEVRNSFSLQTINDDFRNSFDAQRNLVYLWRAPRLESCKVTVGIDNLSSQLNLDINCLGECTLVCNPGSSGHFTMGRLGFRGGAVTLSLNNITIGLMEFEVSLYAGNSVNLNPLSYLIIATQIYASRTLVGFGEGVSYTCYTDKFGDVHPLPFRAQLDSIPLTSFFANNNITDNFQRRGRLMSQAIGLTDNPNLTVLIYSNKRQTIDDAVANVGSNNATRVIIAQSFFYTLWPPLGATDFNCTQSLRLESISNALYFNVMAQLNSDRRLNTAYNTVFVINLWNFMGNNNRPVQGLLLPNGFASFLVTNFVGRWLFGSMYAYQYVQLHYVLGCEYFGMDNVAKALTIESELVELIRNIQDSADEAGLGSSVSRMTFKLTNLERER